MRSLNNQTMILSLLGLSTLNEEFMKKLVEIVDTTSNDRRVNTIIYTSYVIGCSIKSVESTPLLDIPRSLAEGQDKPLLNIDTTRPIENYMRKFNAELLTIAKLNQLIDQDERLLITLWQRLLHNTQTRLILLFEDSASEVYIEKLLLFCAQHKAMRVIALQRRMTVIERSYWILRIFPKPQAVKRTLPTNGTKIFINHTKNMFGHPLHILERALWPQVYRYIPREGGPPQLSGFVGRALVEYVKRRNGTIAQPLDMSNRHLVHEEVISFFKNNTLDIGYLTPYKANDRYISFSVVFQCTDFCFMVPFEPPLPKSTFYFKIISKSYVPFFWVNVVLISCISAFASRWLTKRKISITDYVFNVAVVQGLLGMPFSIAGPISRLHKVIYVSASLAGIIIATAYVTYLQSYSINPPLASKAETIDDLIARGIQLSVTKYYLFPILYKPDFHNYGKNFVVFNNMSNFLILRAKLDTRYAFAITDMWPIYEEQQKYFSQPLFRLSDICLARGYPMVLPLQKNSIYLQSLNGFIERLHEAGLIEHWRRRTFLEMLAMKWVSRENKNMQHPCQPMKLEDLHIVLTVMAGLLCLSILCFVLEIFWFKIEKMFIVLKEMLNKIKIKK